MRWAMVASCIPGSWKLLRRGFADWAYEGHEATLGQLHNSLNGGSVGHGGMELRLAPPPDADTLVPDAPLDAEARPVATFARSAGDVAECGGHFLSAFDAGRWGLGSRRLNVLTAQLGFAL